MDYQKYNGMKDYSGSMDKKDCEENKVLAILAYISILVLVPLFAGKNSKYARFHSNQGLILFIIEVAVSIISNVLSFIPVVSVIVGIVAALISLVCFAFSIIGIINVCQNKAVELPLIGGIRIIK